MYTVFRKEQFCKHLRKSKIQLKETKIRTECNTNGNGIAKNKSQLYLHTLEEY